MKLHKLATTITYDGTTSIYMFDDIIASPPHTSNDRQYEHIIIKHNTDKNNLYIGYRPITSMLINNDNILLYNQNKAGFNIENGKITRVNFNRENPIQNMVITSINELLGVDIMDLELHPEYLKDMLYKEILIPEVNVSNCIPTTNYISIECINNFFDINKSGRRIWCNDFKIQSERYDEVSMQIIKTKDLLNEWYKVMITGLKTQIDEPLQCIFGDVITKRYDLRDLHTTGKLLTGVQKTNLVYEELSPLLNAISSKLHIYLPCLDNNAFNTSEYEPPKILE
jgi:hypothetical protein